MSTNQRTARRTKQIQAVLAPELSTSAGESIFFIRKNVYNYLVLLRNNVFVQALSSRLQSYPESLILFDEGA